MNAAAFDPAITLRLMKNISGDADYVAGRGERAAEQAAMVLDSLFVAYTRNGKMGNGDVVRGAIQGLFKQFEDPSSYDEGRFAAGVAGGE